MRRPITTDLRDRSKRPYFFWDEDISIDELHSILDDGPLEERDRLLGKMRREANDRDVWVFVSPEEVAEALTRIERRLGRRRDFWFLLINGWRSERLLD
jgi:hypothetical protein